MTKHTLCCHDSPNKHTELKGTAHFHTGCLHVAETAYVPLRAARLFSYGQHNVTEFVLLPHYYCKYQNSEFLQNYTAPLETESIINSYQLDLDQNQTLPILHLSP